MNISRAFVAGLVGGLAMSLGLAAVRALGAPAKLELLLGTMLLQPGTGALVLGTMMHFTIAGLIALAYAWGFENLTHRSSAAIGAGFGVVNGIIGGIFMGVVPMLHPLIPETMPVPGFFMANMGILGIMAEMVLHVIYGAIVGAMYEPVGVASARPLRA